METTQVMLERRVSALERKLRISQFAALAAAFALIGVAAQGTGQQAAKPETLRVRRLDVLDDQGVVRVSIGQDPTDAQRRSRACGITVFDTTGNERGGMGTFDDLSAVIALDAPQGVGGPMRDRVGMKVDPDGSAQVVLIDNAMHAPVRLASDAQGGGGLELFGYDLDKKLGKRKRVSFDGEKVSEFPLDDDK
jgi:hypothetical protein